MSISIAKFLTERGIDAQKLWPLFVNITNIVPKLRKGYRVKIYDLEKSVCDAVKFRNKIGVDVSSEILKNYLGRRDRNLTLLNEYAKKMRVANIMNGLIEFMV